MSTHMCTSMRPNCRLGPCRGCTKCWCPMMPLPSPSGSKYLIASICTEWYWQNVLWSVEGFRHCKLVIRVHVPGHCTLRRCNLLRKHSAILILNWKKVGTNTHMVRSSSTCTCCLGWVWPRTEPAACRWGCPADVPAPRPPPHQIPAQRPLHGPQKWSPPGKR